MQRLVWALHHPEAFTALRAATILGKLKATETAEPLAETLEDPATDPYVGAAVARSLGQIGGKRAKNSLIRAIKHAPVPVRFAAIEASAALGPDDEITEVLRRVSEEDSSAGVREAAHRLLDGRSKP